MQPSTASRGRFAAFAKLRDLWPWVAPLIAAVWAVWLATDFPNDVDSEIPLVQRPFFSAYPPKIYRLSEPGDTLDRVALYFGTASAGLAALGWLWSRRGERSSGLWPAALAISLGIVWIGAAPWPTFDGWPGWSWRAILDPKTPPATRAMLTSLMVGLGAMVVVSIWRGRTTMAAWARGGCRDRGLGLVFAVALLCRSVEFPAIEPAGYWHRCGFAVGVLAWIGGLARALPPCPNSTRRWVSIGIVGCGAGALIAAGFSSLWIHRPLGRFKAIVPDQIYISAMPTYAGLETAYARHRFKTILNLFPEGRLGRSPHSDDEQRFAAEHGIRYIESPGGAVGSEKFIRESLAMAQDPESLPMLVHCHACMDRTPAWTAMYRFVVQNRPLLAILRETEQHRGERPKALSFFFWNRVLPQLDSQRFEADPTAPILRRSTAGLPDPYNEILRQEFTQARAPSPQRDSRLESDRRKSEPPRISPSPHPDAGAGSAKLAP